MLQLFRPCSSTLFLFSAQMFVPAFNNGQLDISSSCFVNSIFRSQSRDNPKPGQDSRVCKPPAKSQARNALKRHCPIPLQPQKSCPTFPRIICTTPLTLPRRLIKHCSHFSYVFIRLQNLKSFNPIALGGMDFLVSYE